MMTMSCDRSGQRRTRSSAHSHPARVAIGERSATISIRSLSSFSKASQATASISSSKVARHSSVSRRNTTKLGGAWVQTSGGDRAGYTDRDNPDITAVGAAAGPGSCVSVREPIRLPPRSARPFV